MRQACGRRAAGVRQACGRRARARARARAYKALLNMKGRAGGFIAPQDGPVGLADL